MTKYTFIDSFTHVLAGSVIVECGADYGVSIIDSLFLGEPYISVQLESGPPFYSVPIRVLVPYEGV